MDNGRLRKAIALRRRSCRRSASRIRRATRDRSGRSRRRRAGSCVPPTVSRTPITEAELRKLVNSDLVALLNTVNLDSARGSVGGAGGRASPFSTSAFLTSPAGRSTRTRRAGSRGRLEAALRDFEPRLVRGSIKARRDETVSPDELRVRFLVSAALRMRAGRRAGAIRRRGGA